MIQVVGAALFRENKLLACRRATGKNLEGFWEFPGGKIEPNEDSRSALRRELKEELSINATIISRLTTAQNEERDIKLEVFLVESADTPLISGSHDALLWLSFDQIRDIAWAPLDLPTVDYLGKNGARYLWGK
jgi:8-oxo-dGTP diphosphatase